MKGVECYRHLDAISENEGEIRRKNYFLLFFFFLFQYKYDERLK